VDLTTFFDYPTAPVAEAADEVVFLPDPSERDWEKLLAHTDALRDGDWSVLGAEPAAV
jgi:hypothetical protein